MGDDVSEMITLRAGRTFSATAKQFGFQIPLHLSVKLLRIRNGTIASPPERYLLDNLVSYNK